MKVSERIVANVLVTLIQLCTLCMWSVLCCVQNKPKVTSHDFGQCQFISRSNTICFGKSAQRRHCSRHPQHHLHHRQLHLRSLLITINESQETMPVFWTVTLLQHVKKMNELEGNWLEVMEKIYKKTDMFGQFLDTLMGKKDYKFFGCCQERRIKHFFNR